MVAKRISWLAVPDLDPYNGRLTDNVVCLFSVSSFKMIQLKAADDPSLPPGCRVQS